MKKIFEVKTKQEALENDCLQVLKQGNQKACSIQVRFENELFVELKGTFKLVKGAFMVYSSSGREGVTVHFQAIKSDSVSLEYRNGSGGKELYGLSFDTRAGHYTVFL